MDAATRALVLLLISSLHPRPLVFGSSPFVLQVVIGRFINPWRQGIALLGEVMHAALCLSVCVCVRESERMCSAVRRTSYLSPAQLSEFKVT